MAEPFIAEIRAWGFPWAPRNWSTCDGQILQIAQNQSLYALIGTTYGGDGVTTLGLPELRGRVPLHRGQTHRTGQRGGVEDVTLTVGEMPQHRHEMRASADPADQGAPTGHALASFDSSSGMYSDGSVNATMASGMVSHAGGGMSHTNIQPSLVINFTISLSGLFPSRN